MRETLIAFETARLAKEKGFFDKNVYQEVRLSQENYYDDEGVLRSIRGIFDVGNTYNLLDCCNAPPQSLLQKWLREVHNIQINIQPYHWVEDSRPFSISIFFKSRNRNVWDYVEFNTDNKYNSYEEALERALEEGLKLIEIVKE